MNTQDAIVQKTISQAESWQRRANQLLTSEEKTIMQQLTRLLENPRDRVVMTKLIDQSFRSEDSARVSDQINETLRRFGVPEFFSVRDKVLMRLFLGVGRYFPHVSIPRVVEKMRGDSARSVIPGEPGVFQTYLKKRRDEGVSVNINHIGEVVLGEAEAQNRLQMYLKDLQDDAIETISVKISTILSQISALAFERTVGILEDRLARLYRAAAQHVYERPDGTRGPKMVNLDMEEYRDLEITYEAFVRTLSREEFKNVSAGIVLQAYVPESWHYQKELTAWAGKRVEEGGAPVYLRIVKGANMEMEAVESSINNWPLAPYDNKLDVDANFKRMMEFGMEPENIEAVRMGVASHNLFELALAFQLAKANNVTDKVTFEMLEGMADHVRRAVTESTDEMLLYAPVAGREQFINAIAYLIRRLDENTAPENFLRYACNLQPGSSEWAFLVRQFKDSYRYRHEAPMEPRRVQDRRNEVFPEKMGPYHTGEFLNEPDTDWSLKANRLWGEEIRRRWMKKPEDEPVRIPVVVGGEEVFDGRKIREIVDPGQEDEKRGVRVVTARFALASEEDAETALRTAEEDPDGWRGLSYDERHALLSRAAMNLRKARADLIGMGAAGTGKVYTESDPEVSEAIDFTEWYPHSIKAFEKLPGIRCRGKGVGMVISPWNFPIAIPTGGMAAALAAGNTVIFKPSSDAVLTAFELCRCFWDAGVPRTALQFTPCSGSSVGNRLALDSRVNFVILTGGTDTGMKLLGAKPELDLAAETGGKNATIVTAMSDRDQAIKNVIHSAFSNTGQKCSATSLLILEKEVYEDKDFKRTLADAAESYLTGSPWDFENRMGPLVNPPSGDLERALTQLEPGEEWLVKPQQTEGNPYIWTPGIKWGVRPGSITHNTEFFGPVLAVMRAENLEHAIKLANAPGYGLTSGLESLDPREQEKWKESIIAGNLYINKGTTGAVVLRQPFGGRRKSALGAGIKAGGPNYVAQFMTFEETGLPKSDAIEGDYAIFRTAEEWRLLLQWGGFAESEREDIRKTVRAIKSYLYWMEQEFGAEKDYFHLRGQDNLVRYQPVNETVVRLHPSDSLFETLARIAAARIAGCPLVVSRPPEMTGGVVDFLASQRGKEILGNASHLVQTDAEIVAGMPSMDRLRYAAKDRVPSEVFAKAAELGFYIAHDPVFMEGRIELVRYFREQAVCNTFHRYGNLGERSYH